MTREINRLRLKPCKIIYKNQQLHGEKSNELKERVNLYSTTVYKSVVNRSKTFSYWRKDYRSVTAAAGFLSLQQSPWLHFHAVRRVLAAATATGL